MEHFSSGWTIFTLRGVAIKLHISLLFLLFYVVLVAMMQFSSIVQFSKVNPNDIAGSPFIWALIFAISLVVSIFLHEFGHVLVAQAQGFKVRYISLMMLGGVSQMERLPVEPLAEFEVAIIGPLVSLGIAGLLFWIRAVSLSANLDFYCYWVGQTNLALGIFNLLPAFPTDGGRVLRSILVTRQGHLRGTETAVKVSQVFAWVLGILGVIQFNLLLLLVAVFIYGAAKSELFILLGQTVLKGMRAQDLIISVPAVSEDASVSEAVTQMVNSRNILLPVIGKNDTYGMLSAAIARQVPRELWNSTLIKDVQIKVPKVVHCEEPLEEVLMSVLATPIGALPVIHEGILAGVIRTSDLLETIELRRLIEEQLSINAWALKFRHAHSRA